jgi:carbonic anhydrase/acetyltransferase-like protein (isoleucine patch superfamily)
VSTAIAADLIRAARRAHEALSQTFADVVNSADLGLKGKAFSIHKSAEFRTPAQIRIQDRCVIKARVVLNGRSDAHPFGLELGEDSYLKEGCVLDAYGGVIRVAGPCAFGQNTFIHGGGGVTIGSHVIVGPGSQIIASNHEYWSAELPIMLQGDYRQGIVIGDNVWIGSGVTVLDGVTIGRNVVVGAGTVITKDVPPNTLVYDVRTPRSERLFDDERS